MRITRSKINCSALLHTLPLCSRAGWPLPKSFSPLLGLDLKDPKPEKLVRPSEMWPFTRCMLFMFWHKSLISNSSRRCTRDFSRCRYDGKEETAEDPSSQSAWAAASQVEQLDPPPPPACELPLTLHTCTPPPPCPNPPSVLTPHLDVLRVDDRHEPQRRKRRQG